VNDRDLSHPTNAEIAQVELICDSYLRLMGEKLVEGHLRGASLFSAIWVAPFVVVSHDTRPDPRFNFGNNQALELWEMSADEFVGLPSRYSAEAEHREERARLLQEVAEKGYFADYRGVRASKLGRRFRIERALVFNLSDADRVPKGQAAVFSEWTYL
jgi:hypothetical protein